MTQATINFDTRSPINVESLNKQNKAIYNLLLTRGSITMFDAIEIGVYHLHSRMAELSKVVTIYRRTIKKNGTTVKEYSLKEFVKN